MTVSATPARDSTIRISDGRILAYAEWGPADGTPVLLFHGGPGSRLFCPDVQTTEAERVRLIGVDRPGYGRSDPRPGHTVLDSAADVGELADRLGLERFSIVGWSTGGVFGMACSIALGDRVRSIALCASDAPQDEVAAAFEQQPPRSRELIEAIRADAAAVRPGMFDRYAAFAADPVAILPTPEDAAAAVATDASIDLRLQADPPTRAAYETLFLESARQGAVGLVDDQIARFRPWGFALADIRCPTSVWWGEEDWITERFHSDALARLIPGARLHIVPGAGHSLPVTHWREILSELLAAR